jgi:hypothetical protein
VRSKHIPFALNRVCSLHVKPEREGGGERERERDREKEEIERKKR